MKIEKIAERVCLWGGGILVWFFVATLDSNYLIFTAILFILATYFNKTMVHIKLNFVDEKAAKDKILAGHYPEVVKALERLSEVAHNFKPENWSDAGFIIAYREGIFRWLPSTINILAKACELQGGESDEH